MQEQENRSCERCAFFQPIYQDNPKDPPHGECRRHAPRLVDEQKKAFWPQVGGPSYQGRGPSPGKDFLVLSWCGDFEEKPEK